MSISGLLDSCVGLDIVQNPCSTKKFAASCGSEHLRAFLKARNIRNPFFAQNSNEWCCPQGANRLNNTCRRPALVVATP